MKKYVCNVYPREGRNLGYVHETVNGKIVTIEDCDVGSRAYIRNIKGGAVHTSTVIEVDYLCEGDIRITTRNSIYELTFMGDDDEA